MIVTKELNEKQVSLKDTDKKLADDVHASSDANHAIRDMINQPSNQKRKKTLAKGTGR
jgi:hypothetical protein